MSFKSRVMPRTIEVCWGDKKTVRYKDMQCWVGDPSGGKPLLIIQDTEHRVEIPLEDIITAAEDSLEEGEQNQ